MPVCSLLKEKEEDECLLGLVTQAILLPVAVRLVSQKQVLMVKLESAMASIPMIEVHYCYESKVYPTASARGCHRLCFKLNWVKWYFCNFTHFKIQYDKNEFNKM